MSLIRIALASGADGSTDLSTLYEVTTLDDKVKLPTGSGYRHFTYSGESVPVDDAMIPVFRESAQTKVAE